MARLISAASDGNQYQAPQAPLPVIRHDAEHQKNQNEADDHPVGAASHKMLISHTATMSVRRRSYTGMYQHVEKQQPHRFGCYGGVAVISAES